MHLEQANNLAVAALSRLAPYCRICRVAGSIRRQKPQPGDIEIVCLPIEHKMGAQAGLFGDNAPAQFRRDDGFVNAAASLGKPESGDLRTGRYAKIQLPEGIQLDLFMPQAADFWRQFAIRTGSGGPDGFSMKVIATGWVKKGWRGTDDGLRRHDECKQQNGKWICTALNPTMPPAWESEEAFFAWLGVGWVPPENRSFESDWLPYLKKALQNN